MSSSIDLYKQFIDAMVDISPSVAADRVRSGVWHPEPPPDQVRYNQLLKEFTSEQRELVARIIQEAADSAVHDVLVRLHDDNYQLSKDGVNLAVEPFDTEPFYDYVCRRAGDDWPE